jgi:hypothetical protein
VRFWLFWWQTLTRASQQNPPRFIESLMLCLAIALLMFLILFWHGTQPWPYLVLSLSYGIGASTSILVREMCVPSAHPRLTPVTAAMSSALLIFIIGLLYVVKDVTVVRG